MPTEQDFQSIKTSVEDAVTYPVLTRETAGADYGGRADRGGSSTDSLTRTAQQTIRELLGWRVRPDDSKGFLAALTKTVALNEKGGSVAWTWRPPLYVLQSDMGEITGAQASVHKQASVALEQALPLLDGLRPLRSDADEEDGEAMRAIIRTELRELVSELGLSGGPRVQRIDSFFDRLLGAHPNPDPERVGGQMFRLRDRFGLQRERVNTVLEEQILTNFLILVDYTYSLYNSWQSKRNYFLRNGSAEPFLGTQLVLVSQTLDVIVEQVRETYAAMDSVFFGPAERQATMLNLPNEAPITVAELLDWVETFATQEARQLIQDGGKDGVVIFRGTSERLADLVSKAALLSAQPAANLARAFHTCRVANSLSELATYLGAAKNRAAEISRRPFRLAEKAGAEENLPLRSAGVMANTAPQSVISTIEFNPDEWQSYEDKSHRAKMRLIGRNLGLGLSPEFIGGPPGHLKVVAIEVDQQHGETAVVTVEIAPKAPSAAWDVLVKTSGGQRKTFEKAVSVTPRPRPATHFEKNRIQMKPEEWCCHQGNTLVVTVSEPNIREGVGLGFARDIQVLKVEYPKAGELTATIAVNPNAEPGDVAVELFAADCGRVELPKKFRIEKCPDQPAIFKITTQCECGQVPHKEHCSTTPPATAPPPSSTSAPPSPQSSKEGGPAQARKATER